MKNGFIIYILVILGFLVLQSCSSGPKPIDYGEDECYRCKMIISERQFGAELITTKGRVYKYDAIECLIPEVINRGAENYSHMLVTDYNSPGTFIDATSASYLISKELPSPMGAYLSAYLSNEMAVIAEQRHEGEIYEWDSIVSYFQEAVTSNQ